MKMMLRLSLPEQELTMMLSLSRRLILARLERVQTPPINVCLGRWTSCDPCYEG